MQKIDDATQSGGWRMLCAAALHDAAVILAKRNSRAEDRKIVKHWIEHPDVGVITFRDCCELMGYDVDLLRAKLKQVKANVFRKPAYKRQLNLHESHREEDAALFVREACDHTS